MSTQNTNPLRDELLRLKKDDPEKLAQLLSQLTEEEAEAIVYDWVGIWGRDTQLRLIKSDASTVLYCGGRSAGKTRSAAEAIRYFVENNLAREIALVGATSADVRNTMLYGPSGLLNVFPPDKKPIHEPSKQRINFHNGSYAITYSAEEPSRMRGGNFSLTWGDEICVWKDRDAFDQIMLMTRLGAAKKIFTTTPRANDIIVDLFKRRDKGKSVEIVHDSVRENLHNLSPEFAEEVFDLYGGTRIAQVELEGRLILDAEGALWKMDNIAKQTITDEKLIPDFVKVCIGVDPAVSTGKYSDLTGIVISALGDDGKAYVLEDLTDKYSPDAWVKKVIDRYDYYSKIAPTSIIVEKNNGGNLVKDSLIRNRPLLPVDDVFSSKSKLARAEPIAMLYQQGKVFHTKTFPDLEQEQTSYEGRPREKSPDRLDALVFSIMGCMPTKNRVTKEFNFLL